METKYSSGFVIFSGQGGFILKTYNIGFKGYIWTKNLYSVGLGGYYWKT
jgi:hypothetical protein